MGYFRDEECSAALVMKLAESACFTDSKGAVFALETETGC